MLRDHLVEKHDLKPSYDIRLTITRRLCKLKDKEQVGKKFGEKKININGRMGQREIIWFPK